MMRGHDRHRRLDAGRPERQRLGGRLHVVATSVLIEHDRRRLGNHY